MRSLFYLVIFLFLVSTNNGNAAIMKCSISIEQNQEKIDETIFVDSSQIHFVDRSLFLLIDNEMIPVKNLCGDYRGAFIEVECGVGYWVCPRCANRNELWDHPYCQYCRYVAPK